MKKIILFLLAVPSMAFGKIKTEMVEYSDGKTHLEGYLAYDDANKKPMPGVIVVHEWTGLGDYAKSRAEKLASLGYVAFAADIYGQGVHPKAGPEAAKVAGYYKENRKIMRGRAKAAYDLLAKNEHVDNSKIAVMGYCFGGTVALELARSGAPLKGVVSFHGGLSTPTPDDAKKIKGRVLVLHGGSDPNVPPSEVDAFETEMKNAKLDWQLVVYGQAVHAFTNPDAGHDPAKGAAYNKSADLASWEEMKRFFSEIF